MRLYLFSILIYFSVLSHAMALENVTSDCFWKPANAAQLKEMTNLAIVEKSLELAEREMTENNLYFKLRDRRVYFHSLPNSSCRSSLFIVRGDIVEQVDMLDDLSWLRVACHSKRLNKVIIGWVEFKGMCRILGSGEFGC
jgi:hypothetical protein